jgi:ubiquinol-cytochrome c reductase cytochrome b subunit
VTRRGGPIARWLDDRAGIRDLKRVLLDEPLPAGTAWWFTTGSVLLFGLAVQIITGIGLALFYAPTPDHAWDSVSYITTGVTGGWLLRGLHYWGASLMVVATVVHLMRVVFFGSYRKPRELNWIVGIILLHVVLAFGLTGYLLPWDQRAYWATVVTVNIARQAPLVGEWVASLLQGGSQVGALTLTRWYATHVLILPALTVVLVALHLYLMRRQGISGPVTPHPGRSEMFFPSQAARDMTVVGILTVVLVALAWRGAPPLEPPADPASSDYTPRPEWYFLGFFQLLKFFPGRYEVLGSIVIPGLVMAWLVLLPWLDRARSREPRHRRPILMPFVAGLSVLVALTLLGAMDRSASPTMAWSVRELAGAALIETDTRCTSCHGPDRVANAIRPGRISRPQDWLNAHVLDPMVIAPGLREAPETNQPDTLAIQAALARLRSGAPPPTESGTRHVQIPVLVNRFCLNCHKVGPVGGKDGPDLTAIGLKLGADQIEMRIVDPTAVQADAQMKSLADKISAEDIKRISAWFAARR